jgi:hypothetical protein
MLTKSQEEGEMGKKPRRMGRPPKPAKERMSEVIGIRLPPDLRAALEQSAKGSGQSIGQEVASRLRQSLGDRDEKTRALGLAIRHLSAALENLTGRHWHDGRWPLLVLSSGMSWVLATLAADEDNQPEEGHPCHGSDPEELGRLLGIATTRAMSRTLAENLASPLSAFSSQEDLSVLSEAGRVFGILRGEKK